jgi:hypothetical protein
MNSRGAEFENRSSTDFSGNSNATAFSESDVAACYPPLSGSV